MRRAHDRADIQEQPQPRREPERMGGAVAVQRQALDVFHHQVGIAIGRGATVVEPGHVGQVQSGQHLPLGLQPLDLARARHAVQQLDRNRAPIHAVVALGLEHGAHAAAGDARGQPPRSQPLAYRQLRSQCARQRGIQPAADPAQALGLRMQQLQHVLGQGGITAALLYLLPPLRAWQVADGIEQLAGLAPARCLLRGGHQVSCRLSQALAKRRSRSTVGAETPITMAISSRLMPPK